MNVQDFVKKETEAYPNLTENELKEQAVKDILNIAFDDMEDDLLRIWIDVITNKTNEIFVEIHKQFAGEKWASGLGEATDEQLEQIYFYGDYKLLGELDEESKQRVSQLTEKIKSLLIIT